jgi:hypothetical protein
MKKPSKNEIQARVAKLKDIKDTSGGTPETKNDSLSEKKSSQRIRKQGV